MTAVAGPSRMIGAPIKRREDPRLIQGLSHYVDDIKLVDTLHCTFLRSDYAHAEIKSIDTAAAKDLPGVVTVITGKDIEGKVGDVPCGADLPGLKVPDHPALSIGRVRFVGEPIAAVVATDSYIARDALDLIEVDYEELPTVVDPEKAIEAGSPLIYEEFGDNIGFTMPLEAGDADAAFAEADHVVSGRFVNQRLIPNAMEPRGVLAQYLPGDGSLTVWSSTQVPHGLKTNLGLIVDIPEHLVRVIAPEVGGAFGSKLNVYPEEIVVSYLAIQLCKPVKWIEKRTENFTTTIHGRDQINYVEIAVKNDGTITALRAKTIADIGASYQLLTPLIPTLTNLMIVGGYKIQNVKVELIGALTNKMATDAYRGAGRPEATYIIERIVSMAAKQLGMDPKDIRFKNFPQPEEFPLEIATGITFDSGNYQASLNKALEIVNYDEQRAQQAELRQQGKYMGIGLCTYVEICAFGPSAGVPGGGWESATVRVERTGKVTVLSGVSPHGQGQETSFAQIIGDEFGVDIDDIIIVHGDTGRQPQGIGTFGSRATAVGGTAMVVAAGQVKEKMAKIAAHLMEANPDDLVFENGQIFVGGSPDQAVEFATVAGEAHTAANLPPDTDPGLEATHFFEPSNFTFPFGAHVAVVEVDIDTGEIDIQRYVAVDDIGNIINPLLVNGQVHGGIAQGLGQALYEGAVYDENGQLLTGTFMDYAIPKATHLPRFESDHTVTPSPVNPLGVKGVGEAGTIASTPCMVNAVVDALSPLGITQIDMPMTPNRVWQAIQDAKEGGNG
ncbi:MAG: xanthine dehydrogenase family protein molybdopterin-binding subunit [Candidatus Poribacteria bacterium]|nr:xanthine dehydrogenase family protein molybdopterin-binding subunit [Candidatus Poribacteria bacterium]